MNSNYVKNKHRASVCELQKILNSVALPSNKFQPSKEHNYTVANIRSYKIVKNNTLYFKDID